MFNPDLNELPQRAAAVSAEQGLAGTDLAGDAEIQRRSRLPRATARRLFRQRSALVGLGLLGFLFGVVLLARVVAPHNPDKAMV